MAVKIEDIPILTVPRTTKALQWLAVLVPGLLLYFLPVPGLNTEQRHLLAVFAATIIALVARPVPMGVSVVVAMTVLSLTRTLPPAKILSGFSNATVWLVFTAFLFARAVTTTGLGLRVAYLFIRRFGHSALTPGYSIAAADVALAPFVPSDTARGGGVIYPVARSLCQALDSEPGPTASRIGSFLTLVSFHATYTASAIFLTGMAANPLIADFARNIAHVELTWARWAIGSSVPGLLSLALVPYLIHRLNPPELKDTEPARRLASDKLRSLGRMSREEILLVIILVAVMIGWVSSPLHGIPNAFVALVVAYLYSHYGFASMTAHVTALYPGFLAAALAGGAPGMLAALALAYFSNLNAGITHYGTGSAPIYFGAGYVGQGTWWKLGFLISLLNLLLWLGVGPLWWKLVGLW